MIKISKKYSGIIMELGNSVSPEDIIGMYNELVASEGESSALEKYEDECFWNDSMDEIPVDVILDELNYAPVKKTGRVSDNEFVLSDSGISEHKITFNPKRNEYEFRHLTKNGGGGMTILTDESMKSLLDFLTKRN